MKRHIIYLLFLATAAHGNEITLKSIVDERGVDKVISYISDKTGGELTIDYNGIITTAHKPSKEYITVETLQNDLDRVNVSVAALASYFANKDKRKLEQEQSMKELREQLRRSQLAKQKLREEEYAKRLAKEIEQEKQRVRYTHLLDGRKIHTPGGIWEEDGKVLYFENGKIAEGVDKNFIYKYSSLPAKTLHNPYTSAQRTNSTSPITPSRPNPVCGQSREKAKKDLTNDLLSRYKNSYTTVKTLLDSGMKAYDTICKIDINSISEGILRDLHSRYYPSFSTILTLYNSNVKSYSSLNR